MTGARSHIHTSHMATSCTLGGQFTPKHSVQRTREGSVVIHGEGFVVWGTDDGACKTQREQSQLRRT